MMKMHWTTRMFLAAAFLASLAWAAELPKRETQAEATEVSAKKQQNTDISEPEERVITVGNAGEVDDTKVATAASIVLTGIGCGLLLLFAEFIKGIGARIYPVPEGVGDEEVFDGELNLIPWKGRKAGRPRPATSIHLLEWIFAGIESINSRLLEEERMNCRKLTLCQIGIATSGYSFFHSVFEIIRPAVPLLDDNWDGLMAGKARENCNVMYERCPIGILSSFFRPNPEPETTTTATVTTSTTHLPPHKPSSRRP